MGGLEIFLLPLLLVGLLWFMGAPQRRMRKEQAALMSTLAPGADVMTHGGLYGTVVAIEDDVVVLETSPGMTMRWAKRAIATVVTPIEDDAADDDSDDELDEEYSDEDYSDEEYSDEEYADEEFADEESDVETDVDGSDEASEEAADDWEDVEVPDDASSLTSDDDDKPKA